MKNTKTHINTRKFSKAPFPLVNNLRIFHFLFFHFFYLFISVSIFIFHFLCFLFVFVVFFSLFFYCIYYWIISQKFSFLYVIYTIGYTHGFFFSFLCEAVYYRVYMCIDEMRHCDTVDRDLDKFSCFFFLGVNIPFLYSLCLYINSVEYKYL